MQQKDDALEDYGDIFFLIIKKGFKEQLYFSWDFMRHLPVHIFFLGLFI